jgi:integrase
MANLFKIEKCFDCKKYKHHVGKPGKTNKPCPKCGATMRYLDNWYLCIQIDGKKYPESTGTANRRHAEDCLAKRMVEVREGKFFDRKEAGIPWSEAVKELEDSYPNLSPKTVAMYKNSSRVLNPFFRHLKLSDIGEEHLKRYKEQRLAEGIAGATFNRDRATLKRIFALNGVEWRFKKTVFDREKETERDRFLTEDEKRRLMEECKRIDYLYMAILTDLDTGLRKTPLLTLKWSDFDFDNNLVAKVGKGGKKSRIPLTVRLRQALLDYRKRQTTQTQWVFPNPNNPEEPIRDLKRSFKTACKRAGIKDLRFHDLRRSFGSWLVMTTKDITLAQELLGHEDISTTRRHYGHLLDDHVRAGMEIFERATVH